MTLTQHQCPWGKAPRMAVASVCVPRASCDCLVPLRGDSPGIAGRFDPGAYQVLLLPWVLEPVRILYVPFKSEVSISCSYGTLKISPTGLQS